MTDNAQAVWLVGGVRTPFVGVDGPFAQARFAPFVGACSAGNGTAGAWADRFRGLGLGGAQSRLRQSGPRGVV